MCGCCAFLVKRKRCEPASPVVTWHRRLYCAVEQLPPIGQSEKGVKEQHVTHTHTRQEQGHRQISDRVDLRCFYSMVEGLPPATKG